MLPNLSHTDSHALSPVGGFWEATRTWYVQHDFSDCRCGIVRMWYNDNFLTRGCNKNQI